MRHRTTDPQGTVKPRHTFHELAFRLQRWGAAGGIFVLNVILSPAVSLAQDDPKVYDARLEGYNGSVTLEGGSTAVTWLLVLALSALCVGVLFKNANRSHLD